MTPLIGDSGLDRIVAWIRPASGDIPGLVDVSTSDGRDFTSLTMNQVETLAAKYGWDVRKDR